MLGAIAAIFIAIGIFAVAAALYLIPKRAITTETAAGGRTAIAGPPPLPAVTIPSKQDNTAPQDVDQGVRAGIQQAKLGELGSKILSFETLVLAVVAGGLTRSWAVGIFAFICLIALTSLVAKYEKVGTIVAGLIGVVWGMVAGMAVLGADKESVGLAVAAGAFAMLVGMGGNLMAFQYLRDLQRAKG